MDEHLIDKRVIERQIRKGKLDAKEHRKTLASLPDSSDRVARSAPEAPMTSSTMSAAVAAPSHSQEPLQADADDDVDDDDDDEESDDDAPANAQL